MNMWENKKIGDIVDIRRGASPRPIQNFLSDKGMPWVKIADATSDPTRFISHTNECIIEDGIKKSVVVEPETLIVSNSATPGLPKIMKILACVHDGWLVFSNYRGITRDFLYYKFIDIRRHLVNQANGSVFQNLKTDIVREFDIAVPSIETQNKIVGILSSIDHKIETNIAINDNLEQQAQSYFQELFVDNADPEWTTGTISDLGVVVGGSTPSKAKPEYYTESGIAWITPKDLSINKSKFISHGENDITDLGLKNSSATIMPEGTVLFSSRAPIGYIAIAAGEVTTNQGFKSVVPKPEIGTPFVYFFLKHNLPIIEGMASGSTFKEVSGSTMKSIPAVIPDTDTLGRFNDFCVPIFAQQRILEKQSQSLAALRDSLLPKLMSGEIGVSDIQL